MKDEFSARLDIISHSITPEELNNTLGMTCDESHYIGDLRKNTIIHEKENDWTIKSRLPRTSPLEDHIVDLLERISPITDKIRSVADKSDVEIEVICVIFTSERPAIFFTKEQVKTIYEMGASIDIDLYWVPGDDEE